MPVYLNASLIIICVMLLGDEDGFIVTFYSPETELQNI